MGDEVVIEKITEETTFDAGGNPQQQIRVTYRVGKDGPFSRLYQKATFEPSRARSDIDAFASDLRALRRE